MTQQQIVKATAMAAGLKTENSELVDDRDSSRDETNFELLTDGTRRRRRPIIEELSNRDNYRTIDRTGPLPNSEERFSGSYLWKSPGQSDDYSILVEELHGVIKFYKVDHNVTDVAGAKQYLTKNQYYDELMLRLWGNAGSTGVTERQPSTYTSGAGFLYIFNKTSGTIRVNINRKSNIQLRGALNFTPIGTWVRDFNGASTSKDNHKRTPVDIANTTFHGNVPTNDKPAGMYGLTDDLSDADLYNLSNQGWPSSGIAAVRDQSTIDAVTFTGFGANIELSPAHTPRWPANYDRYLDGRQEVVAPISVNGLASESKVDAFSYLALHNASPKTGEPGKGSRVGSSDFMPAGATSSTPINYLKDGTAGETAVVEYVNGTIRVRITSATRFQSTGNNWPASIIKSFVHAFTFYVTLSDDVAGTKDYMGGFSGVVDASSFAGSFTQQFAITFDPGVANQILSIGQTFASPTTASECQLWIYRSDANLPYAVEGDSNGFDYRKETRPAGGAFYANRLWQTADSHDRLYYSQLISQSGVESTEMGFVRESFCYGANDPTAAIENAQKDTDGGYVYMPNSGQHYGATVVGDSLYVMTSTGIYQVSAGGAGYFKPSDFRVEKLTEREVYGPKAFANLGNSLVAATDGGVLVVDPEGDNLVQLISDPIRSLYRELSDPVANNEIMLVYSVDADEIRIAFSPKVDKTATSGVLELNLQQQKTTILTFSRNAWYRYDTALGGVIRSMLALPPSVKTETYNRYRYLVCTPNGTAGGATNNLRLSWGVELDWNSTGTDSWVEGSPTGYADYRQVTGTDNMIPVAFLESNHYLIGEGLKFSQLHYIVTHNRNVATHYVEDAPGFYHENKSGSLLLSVRWDWMDRAVTGKFSQPQETHKFRRSFITAATSANPTTDRGEPVLVHKMKVRGRGREFRIRYDAQGDFDAHLIGYLFTGLILESD